MFGFILGRHRKPNSVFSNSVGSGNNVSQQPTGVYLANSAVLSQPAASSHVPSSLGFNHIQIQPARTSGKAGSKLTMQPVSLTMMPMMAAGQAAIVGQATAGSRALLLKDDRRSHDSLTQHSASPSNLIS